MSQNWTNVLLWIVFGAIIGWVASAIVGVGSNLGIDIIVGIAGAIIGGWITGYSTPGSAQMPGINWRSFLVSLLGAIILLAIVKLLS